MSSIDICLTLSASKDRSTRKDWIHEEVRHLATQEVCIHMVELDRRRKTGTLSVKNLHAATLKFDSTTCYEFHDNAASVQSLLSPQIRVFHLVRHQSQVKIAMSMRFTRS